MPTSQKTQRMTITIPREEYAKIMSIASKKGMTLSSYVRRSLADAVDREGISVNLHVTVGGKREDEPTLRGTVNSTEEHK